MKSYASKLIEITERHAEAIAKQWYNNIKMNPRTPYYHGMPEEKAVQQAMNYYNRFVKLFLSDSPFEEAQALFTKYAEESFRARIPLPQLIYAITLMRRHMWLYTQYENVFTTAAEHHQATESLNRTILMFDYATYVIVSKYEELIRRDVEDQFKALKIKNPPSFWWGASAK